jgi:hypothetical protein
MVRTNLSACAFRFGDRGGSLTDFTPAPVRRQLDLLADCLI